MWLVDQNFTIGKAANNSLMINEKDILDHHVQITNALDKLVLENTSSSSNVLLNGKPVATQADLSANDLISIGSIELELIDPKSLNANRQSDVTTNFSSGWSIYSNASWLDQSRFSINKKTVIGRDPGCDITLPLEHLSRKHVVLEIKGGQLYVEDLDSSNGTFLNGKKVKQSIVNNGDKIKIDVLTFEVNGPAHDPNKTIIRTASDTASVKKKETSSSRVSTKVQHPEKKQTPNAKPKSKPNPVKKRLVSDGKQDWIKEGDNAQTDSSSSKTGLIIIGAVVACSLVAAALVML